MLKQYSSVQTSPETRFTRVIINNMRLHQSKVCVWLQPVNVFRNLLHIYRDLQIDMHQSDEPTGPTITWEMILGMCCCDTWEPVTRMRKPISFFSFHCQMHRHQTMCHRAEPHRPDRERMERWRRSGGRVRHTNGWWTARNDGYMRGEARTPCSGEAIQRHEHRVTSQH